MLFGEPTNNQIFTGHKGLMDYEITFIGKKSHASTPGKGISANMNAVKFLYELEDYYIKKIKVDCDNNYEVPYTTFNVGIIDGGSAKNSVAASCKVTLDFRVIKNSHIKKIDKKINSLINKYSATKKVIDIIEPFVDIIDFRGGECVQLSAYQDCYDRFNKLYDWIAFFDIDEFLTIADGNDDIHKFLNKKEFLPYQLLHINWKVYGDNDLLDNDGRNVIERFVEPLPYNTRMYSRPGWAAQATARLRCP